MAGHGKQCYVKSRCYSLALCRVAWCLVVKKRARIEAFTLEIALKIIALGVGVLKDPWNWFDTFLAARRDVPLPLPHQVACWYIDTLGQDLLPVNTTLLRLLRLMRLLAQAPIHCFRALVLQAGSLDQDLCASEIPCVAALGWWFATMTQTVLPYFRGLALFDDDGFEGKCTHPDLGMQPGRARFGRGNTSVPSKL